MKILAALLLTLASCATTGAAGVSEQRMMGSWCSGSENSDYETFELTIENGQRLFRSWLHERPDSIGTWSLSPQELSISGGPTYTILGLSPDTLQVRRAEDEPQTYVRRDCRAVETPPLSGAASPTQVAPNNSFKPKLLRNSA
jgi:hypothetical protein